MCRKLIYLVSVVLVLALASNASATLLARYNFENNLNDTASGGVGGTLTAVGQAATSTAQKAIGSYSLALDGTGDSAKAADSGKLQLGANFTIAAWVRFDVTTGKQTVVSKGDFVIEANRDTSYLWWYETNMLRLQVSNDGEWAGTYTRPSWSPSVDTWYHVAVTVSGTSCAMYLDGSFLGSGNVETPPYATDALFTIGDVDNGTMEFDGYIDDVGVWDTALSAGDIYNVKTYGVPEPATIALLGLGGLALLRRKR